MGIDENEWALKVLRKDLETVKPELNFLRLERGKTYPMRILPQEPQRIVSIDPAHGPFERTVMTIWDCQSKVPMQLSMSRRLQHEIEKLAAYRFAQSYQFRFPRSKKKRIRNKWAKDKRNWRNISYLDFEVEKRGEGIETYYVTKPLTLGKPLNRTQAHELNLAKQKLLDVVRRNANRQQ